MIVIIEDAIIANKMGTVKNINPKKDTTRSIAAG
jgi:hypothetical protein